MNSKAKTILALGLSFSFAFGTQKSASAQSFPSAPAQSSSITVANSSSPTKRQVIVSLPDRKLAVVEKDAVIKVFAVAVGASVSPTPTGTFEIVSRLSDPTYYHAGVVIPAGKDNP